MSTQINAGTQLGTIGVDEVLGERRRTDAPETRSIEARRPLRQARRDPDVLNIAAAIVLLLLGLPRVLDGQHVVPAERADHQPRPALLAR